MARPRYKIRRRCGCYDVVMRTARPLSAAAADGGLPVPRTTDVAGVLEEAARATGRGERGAMATVLARRGSAPGTPGQKLYLSAGGACVGTVGGGAVERVVLTELTRICGDESATHEVRTFKLGPELGMCCGGQLDVLLEPIAGAVPCLVVGAGHVGTALAPLLSRVGFRVTVVDPRVAWSAEGRIDGVTCLVGEVDEVCGAFPVIGPCVVMTHDHAVDQAVIEWALRRGHAFVGGVGSRAKAERTRARLEAKGFSEADRARVRMPLGLDIGARTPDEIAVSAAAELVAWRRERGAGTG
jgi:xanthine dehydrogenase accessory factor